MGRIFGVVGCVILIATLSSCTNRMRNYSPNVSASPVTSNSVSGNTTVRRPKLANANNSNLNDRQQYRAPRAVRRINLNDVKIAPDDPSISTYRFSAKAPQSQSFNEILSILYCRAEHYKTDHGFDGWRVKRIQNASPSNPNVRQTVSATVRMYKEPLPEDAKPNTKDWCAELEQAQLQLD